MDGADPDPRGPEKSLLEALGSLPWLRGRKGLSGSAEPTLVTATPPRSHRLNPRSRQPQALRRKGRPLEEAAQRQRNGPFEAGALEAGAGAGAGSGRVRGALRGWPIARTAARTAQVTRGSGAAGRAPGMARGGAGGRGPGRGFNHVTRCRSKQRGIVAPSLGALARRPHLHLGRLGGVERILYVWGLACVCTVR